MLRFLAIMLLSAGTLLFELALLRIFAVQQFYHFAFMAVSLALLGAGASGSLLMVSTRRISKVGLSLAFSISTACAYMIINFLPFDSFSIAWDRRQLLFLAIYFLAAAVPFLFSGLLVGGELMDAGKQDGGGSHRVYAANLLGSSFGSLFSLLFLDWFGGPGTVLWAIIAGALAGLLFTIPPSLSLRDRPHLPKSHANRLFMRIALFIVILGGVGILTARPPFWQQTLSPYKTLATIKQTKGSDHTLMKEDAAARIDVVESETIHVLPGLSLLAAQRVPQQAGLLVDGDNLMPITSLDVNGGSAQSLMANLPGAFIYALRPGADVLVLEAGTGLDVLGALALGARRVTAVEENETILEIMRGEYGAYTSNLYDDPRVHTVNQPGRVYARSAVPHYDLVLVSLTDQHRPVTSGAFSLTEDYVYTQEAMVDYQTALNDGGILAITRWLQSPPSESARLFGTMAAAIAQDGRSPADHLLAFRTLRTMTVLAAARPFTPDELSLAREFLAARGFDIVYLPGVQEVELNRFNLLPEAVYHDLFLDILERPAEAYADYAYDVTPPSDNKPFFFHFFRWRQTSQIIQGLGRSWQPFGGSGFLVLIILLLFVSIGAALFILVPLLLLKRKKAKPQISIRFWRWRVFIYFAALGLAYLFIEMTLAQRFILLLGKPVTALAIVLFAMLFFSGLGSLSSRRWPLSSILPILVILVFVFPFILDWLLPWALAWSVWGKVVLTILILAPLSYLMGMPFAAGLFALEKVDGAAVPWAWAINGSFSVISSILAVMLALTWGFTLVLSLGALAYGLGWLVFGRIRIAAPA